jgi:hypothetical protein
MVIVIREVGTTPGAGHMQMGADMLRMRNISIAAIACAAATTEP